MVVPNVRSTLGDVADPTFNEVAASATIVFVTSGMIDYKLESASLQTKANLTTKFVNLTLNGS